LSERVLVVRMSAMGDVVQSTPVARGIKAARPDCHLTWFVNRPFAPLLEHNPHIDQIIAMPSRPTVSDAVEAWWRLKQGEFDIAIDLQGLAKSAIPTLASGAPRRIGKGEAREAALLAYTELSPERWDQQYISQRYLEMCAPLGVSRDDLVPELFLVEEDFALIDRVYEAEGIAPGEPVVVLVTFSLAPKREWPPEFVIELADDLTRRHGARIVIPGAASERPRAEAVSAQMSRPAIILAGDTSMREAAAVLQRADLAIGVESGLTHMAYAVRTPTVCILTYPPLRNGPVGPNARTVYVPDLPCRPCRPSAPCEHYRCVRELTPDLVLAAIDDLATDTAIFSP